MDTGPPPSAIDGPGPASYTGRPSAQDMTSYDTLSSQNFGQSTQSTQDGYYQGSPRTFLNGQGDSRANSRRAPNTLASFAYLGANAQPMFTSPPVAPLTANTLTEMASNEPEYPQGELHRRSFSLNQTSPQMTAPSPLYVNGRPQQQVYSQPGPVFGTQTMAQQSSYQFLSQAPVNLPVPADTQHTSSVGLPPIYPPGPPRSSPYVQFPQSGVGVGVGVGVAPGISQHRRHHRNQSLASTAASTSLGSSSSTTTATTPTTSSSRFGAQNPRRRSRPIDDTGSQLPRRMPSSHVPRAQATATTATTAATDSPTTADYYPMLNAQQRAEIARRLQLGELLRSVHSDEVRALQLYEESLLASRRYRQEFDTYEASPPPKGLDGQNDGRPKPKESADLTVNLECKICMSQLVDTVMLPCGHAILCRWCADQHMPSSRVDRTRPKGHAICPMCRTVVKQKFRIYLS